jgi:DNA-binding GntR family transcriptional regulator
LALDREFHVAVAGILDNAVLARFVGQLFDQRINPYFVQLARYFENEGTWRQALSEHRAVRDAIAAGDGEGARAAMRRHLRLSQERFSRSFGDTAVSPATVGLLKPAAHRRADEPHANIQRRNEP